MKRKVLRSMRYLKLRIKKMKFMNSYQVRDTDKDAVQSNHYLRKRRIDQEDDEEISQEKNHLNQKRENEHILIMTN